MICKTEIIKIHNAVRGKIVDLTIQLNKKTPDISKIDIGEHKVQIKEQEKVQPIVNNIYGNSTIKITQQGNINETLYSFKNKEYLTTSLLECGVPKEDLETLVQIIEIDKPRNKNEPLGDKTKKWMLNKIGKGLWEKVGADIISECSKKLIAYWVS